MHTTLERPAPAAHENNGRKQFEFDGSPDEPDVIYHSDGRVNWTTTREERARANQIWQQEGQVPYPDNAAANLERTERMLRFHLKLMDKAKDLDVPTQANEHENLSEPIPYQAEGNWAHDPTSEFVIPTETAPQQTVAETEYIGRHRKPERNKRSLRMRIPLHRLIGHGSALYRARHTAK